MRGSPPDLPPRARMPVVFGDAVPDLHRHVAIARPAPFRAALDLALLGNHDQRIAAAIAAVAHPLELHGVGPEPIMRGGVVDLEQDGDALDAVFALGHQRHLVAVRIGQCLGSGDPVARDLETRRCPRAAPPAARRANGSSSGSSRSCDGGAAACRRPACPCDRRAGPPSAARRRAARRAWSRKGRHRGAAWRDSWRKCIAKRPNRRQAFAEAAGRIPVTP